jgi:uncharacterized protein YegL
MGCQAIGVKNTNSNILLAYEGLINENYFKLQSKESELITSVEYLTGIGLNPYNKKQEYFIGLLLKSKFDGMKEEEIIKNTGETDFSITLDISGSMSGNKIELAKEALIKMIDNLKEGNQISILTFNTESQLIIPLSPKSEILMLKEKIKSIKADGGTDLYNALDGAYEALKNSKKKFKRIIIITDGWCDDKRFIELAEKITNENIGISVVAIESNSNAQLFEKLCKLKGCNYFVALKNEDLKKYLVDQFGYLNFEVSNNIKLNFESDECEIIKAIGTNSDNKDVNNLCNIISSFPSDLKLKGKDVYQEGGLILLKIKPKNNNNIGDKIKLNIKLEYTGYDDKNYIQNYPIEFIINEGEFYSNDYIKKGIALYYYGKIRRKIFKFLNSNIKFNTGGPFVEEVDKDKYERYLKFLRRDNENIDKIKKYFNQNYFNDIVQEQKENYLKTLEDQYEMFLRNKEIISQKVVEKKE